MSDRPPWRETRPGPIADLAFGASEIVPLGSISNIVGGVTLGRSFSGSDRIELPYLRVANVQDGFIDTSEMKMVHILRTELERYRLRSGDVLMTEGGDFDKLGRGAVWDGSIDPCLHQNHIFRVRCNPAFLLPEYLAIYSASPAGRRRFLLLSKQTTNLASINLTQLKAFPIPIPELREQRRIIEALGSADEVIHSSEHLISKLEQTKRGLLHVLLGLGNERNVLSRHEGRHGPLGDFLTCIESGWSPACEDISPIHGEWGVLKVNSISGGSYQPTASKRLPKSLRPRPNLEVHPGDVLLARANGVAELVATVVEVDSTPPCLMLSDKTLRLIPVAAELTRPYLYLLLNSFEVRRQVLNLISGSSGQKNISQQQIRRITVTVPPRDEQDHAVSAWKSHMQAISVERQRLAKLRLIKRGLMDDLLAGRARVNSNQDVSA